MKTSYKYIKFERWDTKDCKRWQCLNKQHGECLGQVIYYEPWHQWVMDFEIECVFNNTCLNDISHFLTQLNKQEGSKGKIAKRANSK